MNALRLTALRIAESLVFTQVGKIVSAPIQHDIVALVADDLTGASDSAVQFSRAGWEARLLLHESDAGIQTAGSNGLLLAVTADNRASEPQAAERATAQAVTTVLRLGARLLYIKVDSTMRGSIPAQVAGALEAWRANHPNAIAVVCPAYPSMGRSVSGNVLTVNGVPVADTPIGIDPVTPVTASSLIELVPGSYPLAEFGAATDGEALALALQASRTGGPVIYTADATSDAELESLADAISRYPGSVIPVGSAGLATALARSWQRGVAGDHATVEDVVAASGDRRVLVQVTSLNELSRRQLVALEEHYAEYHEARTLVLAPSLATVSSRDAVETWFRTQQHDFESYGLVVVSAPEERANATDSSLSQTIAANLSWVTAQLLRPGIFAVAGFIGGDGARAVLNELGATALRVIDNVEEGIPLSIIVDGLVPETVVFTKAGGFGTPESLITVVARVSQSLSRRIHG